MTVKESKASAIARRILREVGESLPVDIKGIIEQRGIGVLAQPMEDAVSGMLVIKDSRATIGVNENHHPNRQRFTLAHELGHYLLHSKSSRVFIDASPVFFRDERAAEGTDPREIEANRFAAELLMPEALLRETVRRQPIDAFDERAVQRLAARFGVSSQAMTIRLATLGLGSL